MPPHDVYVEGFLGSGAVLRHKRPALLNYGVDRSRAAIDLAGSLRPGLNWQCYHGPFLKFLQSRAEACYLTPSALVYLDPPYLPETRKGGDLYDFEMTGAEHVELLRAVTSLDCMVMVSGYPSQLYDDALTGWRRIDYLATTRRGQVDECLWMNFPAPVALHDYSFLGGDYRERERIKRKKARWAAKFQAMDRQERLAVMDALTGAMEGDK